MLSFMKVATVISVGAVDSSCFGLGRLGKKNRGDNYKGAWRKERVPSSWAPTCYLTLFHRVIQGCHIDSPGLIKRWWLCSYLPGFSDVLLPPWGNSQRSEGSFKAVLHHLTNTHILLRTLVIDRNHPPGYQYLRCLVIRWNTNLGTALKGFCTGQVSS